MAYRYLPAVEEDSVDTTARYNRPDAPAPYLPYPPTLTPIIYSVVGSLLAILTLFLLIHTVINVLQGTSTVEIERRKIRRRLHVQDEVRTRVWVPSETDITGRPPGNTRRQVKPGRVVEVAAERVRLYDFGWKDNWKRAMARSPSSIPCRYHIRPIVERFLFTHSHDFVAAAYGLRAES